MRLNPIGSNMTEICVNGAKVLFSYQTPVACEFHGKLYKTEKKWSKTTSRHINKWLEGRIAEEAYQSFFDTLIETVTVA
jgi:hypothetical protein